MSLKDIWGGIEEFSIDWLTYQLPYLGRIIKMEPIKELTKLEVK
jgi:hypothetical protein